MCGQDLSQWKSLDSFFLLFVCLFERHSVSFVMCALAKLLENSYIPTRVQSKSACFKESPLKKKFYGKVLKWLEKKSFIV